MGKRTDLQDILESLLESDKVYFQPPTGFKISYPCIIYGLNDITTEFADDKIYKHRVGYTVTHIDQNPDSLIPGKLLTLPMCKFDRHYKADNLYHTSFVIYY